MTRGQQHRKATIFVCIDYDCCLQTCRKIEHNEGSDRYAYIDMIPRDTDKTEKLQKKKQQVWLYLHHHYHHVIIIFVLRDADKRAAALAKRQMQESKRLENPPPTGDTAAVSSDGDFTKPLLINGAGKTTPDEPRSPLKKPPAEIPQYPTMKAQSLPIPSQTLRERNKRVGAGDGGKVSLPKVDVYSSSEMEDNVSTKDVVRKKKKVTGGVTLSADCSPTDQKLCSVLTTPALWCAHHCYVVCSPVNAGFVHVMAN